MTIIRPYQPGDTFAVGCLVANTYAKYNLAGISDHQRNAFLGPFLHAQSTDTAHQVEITAAIQAPMVLVAEDLGRIVGVLRGGRTDHLGRTLLQSLFVDGNFHRQGIGRQLVTYFEQAYNSQGVEVFKLAATLFAVPFYQNMGYKKSTSARSMRSFDQAGLPYQPMKKVVKDRRPE